MYKFKAKLQSNVKQQIKMDKQKDENYITLYILTGVLPLVVGRLIELVDHYSLRAI